MKQSGCGRITAHKMPFRNAKPVPTEGYDPIFPNNWHGHAFGYGTGDFSSLSPMQLGPVVIDGKATAKNIENYYQFAKVFPNELLVEKVEDCPCRSDFKHARPSELFFTNRDKAYADPVPHRHKKKGVTPAYSCYEDRHYTYVESRWFYCIEMERLAKPTDAFKKLVHMYENDGRSLEIFGYDAYVPNGTDHESLYKHYIDPKRPFGHEMVLLTMIALGEHYELYPWNRYRREHVEIYVGNDGDQSSKKHKVIHDAS